MSLVYLLLGILLQVSCALIPYFFRRVYLPEKPARLGGNWFSVALVNLGSVFLWASILIAPAYGSLHATVYALWALALIPIGYETWLIVQRGMENLEEAMSS